MFSNELSQHATLSESIKLRYDTFPPNKLEMANTKKLSLLTATLCVVDLFGVFPIVALPKAIIMCGFYGAPLVLTVIALQVYTAILLGRCWVIAEKIQPDIEKKNRYPYAAIAELTYGKAMQILVTILLDVTWWGAGIPNFLVASQNLNLLGYRISNGTFDFSFCWWLFIIGFCLCPLMWLGSPKNMSILVGISVAIVTAVAFLTWYCIYSDDIYENKINRSASSALIDNSADFPSLINFLKAYGILSFQFDLHPMLLTIQMDMKRKTQIGQAVCIGFLLTFTMAMVTTVLGAVKYGPLISANILEILPRSWPLYLTILLVTLQLCLSNAVGQSALFQHVEEILGISRDFCFKRCLIRSGLILAAIIVGEILPKFDVFMSVVGGTLTGPLIFILPPLFFRKIKSMENNLLNSSVHVDVPPHNKRSHNIQNTVLNRINNYHFKTNATIIFGVTVTLIATYFNFGDLSRFKFWSPCIRRLGF